MAFLPFVRLPAIEWFTHIFSSTWRLDYPSHIGGMIWLFVVALVSWVLAIWIAIPAFRIFQRTITYSKDAQPASSFPRPRYALFQLSAIGFMICFVVLQFPISYAIYETLKIIEFNLGGEPSRTIISAVTLAALHLLPSYFALGFLMPFVMIFPALATGASGFTIASVRLPFSNCFFLLNAIAIAYFPIWLIGTAGYTLSLIHVSPSPMIGGYAPATPADAIWKAVELAALIISLACVSTLYCREMENAYGATNQSADSS